MPSVIALDTFSGTTGGDLATHTADTGQAWAKNTETGTAIITSTNRVRGGTAKTRYDLNVTPSTADVDIDLDVTVVTLAATGGIICRSVGNSTRVQFFYSASGQTWGIEDGAGNTVATSSLFPMTLGTAYHVTISCHDALKSITVNGSLLASSTSNVQTANGKAGVQWSADAVASDLRGIQYDNFQVTDPAINSSARLLALTGVGS